jgi:hypothetical protein
METIHDNTTAPASVTRKIHGRFVSASMSELSSYTTSHPWSSSKDITSSFVPARLAGDAIYSIQLEQEKDLTLNQFKERLRTGKDIPNGD